MVSSRSSHPRRSVTLRLVGSSESAPNQALWMRIAEANIEIVSAAEPADVTVVDLRDCATDSAALSRNVHAGHQAANGTPVVCLVDAAQLSAHALTPFAANDTIVPATASGQALIAAISRAVRRMDETRELSTRYAALGAHDLPIARPYPSKRLETAIMLCDASPSTLPLINELSCRLTLRTALSRSQVLQSLEAQAADAFLLLARDNRRQQAGLIRLLRRHTNLSEIPIYAIEKRVTARHETFWTEVGADLALPADDPALIAATLRRACRANTATDTRLAYLKTAVVSDSGDPSTLAGGRFFDTSLAHRSTLMPGRFSLGVIRLDPRDGTGHTTALSEAASYMALSSRPGDLVTRPTPDTLVISYAGTDVHRARSTLHATAQMIRDLRFGPYETPCTFAARYAAAQHKPGETARDLLRRVFEDLPAPAEQDLLFA